MTATFDFDRLLGSVLEADGPQAVPADFVDGALATAREVGQRRPISSILDRRAWPTRRGTAGFTATRVVVLALVALLVLALVAVLVVGGPVVRPTRPDILGSLDGVLEPIGRLSAARDDPTLVALKDGRVLIAGGAGPGAPAEIVDPTTGRTEPVGTDEPDGPISVVRLLDGRVLVFGWTYAEPASDGRPDVRIFDPATNTFSPAGPMVAPRFEPSILLLHDGRVLVSGGLVNQEAGPVLSAELFDPATDTFAPSGWEGDWLYEQTAIQVDDGRILVAGGCVWSIADLTCPSVAAMRTIDPSTGRSTPVAPMRRTRQSVGALRLDDGRILIFDRGQRGDERRFGRHGIDPVSTDIFDPKTNTVTAGPALPHSVTVAVSLSDGRVFLAGHWDLLRAQTSLPPTGAPGEGQNADRIDDWWIGLFDPLTGEVLTSPDKLGGGSNRISDIHVTHSNATVLPDDHVLMVAGSDIEVFH